MSDTELIAHGFLGFLDDVYHASKEQKQVIISVIKESIPHCVNDEEVRQMHIIKYDTITRIQRMIEEENKCRSVI